MKVKQTIITKVDLKKLLKAKGIPSIRRLAKIAKVDYSTLAKCNNGSMTMSEEMWNKIKFFI